MENLFNLLKNFLGQGEIPMGHYSVQVTQDENGDFVVRYTNPKNSQVLKKIHEELDAIDDAIFIAAAEAFMKGSPDAYAVMAKIDDPQSIDEIQNAYNIFKTYVVDVAEKEIKSLNERANELFNKYCAKGTC